MKLQVEEQGQDARIVVADDGATVVIVRPGVLSERGVAVMSRVLGLLDNPEQVVAYPSGVLLRDSVEERE